ncbi:DUF2975 domain-containing protein [Altererythrobacter sp.]|uniref:DUF2975 domain-containing protein n=1 Tax=Altererythrobacter sp. TaxID=1872480 RepID=UPI003D0340F8
MNNANSDPLLLAGKVLAIFMQIAMAFGAVALLIGMPALIWFRADILAEYVEEVGDPSVSLPLFSLIGIMLIGLAMVAAMFVFFGKLRQIIDTVGQGDPFQPANADRLSLMGWLIVGLQLLVLPATAIGLHLAQFADKIKDANFSLDSGFDLATILLAVILFILARVFRHGAAMREDLEGTV